MPSVIVLLSLVGIVFLTIRLATDSGNWPTYGLGIAACIFVWARHAKVARSNRKIASAPFLHEIHDEATLGEALASKRVVLYKHSTSCPVSAIVIDEVLRRCCGSRRSTHAGPCTSSKSSSIVTYQTS